MSMYYWKNFPEKNFFLLWEEAPGWQDGLDQDPPSLTPYLAEGAQSAVVICPGGGYAMKASHEGENYAWMLNKAGISAFVLNYRVAPFRHPLPLMDVQRAIRYLRVRGAEYGLPEGAPIGVMGSSAGGHLAVTAATLFDEDLPKTDAIDEASARPDACILCYPVVTLEEPFTHIGSRDCLLGEKAPALAASLSGEKIVKDNTPPTFIWHTVTDGAVPVENSLNLAASLRAHKVPFELHLFPEGSHGLGLAEDMPELAVWAALAVTFLKKHGF